MIPGPIAAVFAHPDDEMLACGGTLAAAVDAGHEVRILLLARGLEARGDAAKGEIDEIRRSAQRATAVIGATEVVFGDFPDNRMDTVALLDVVKAVEVFTADFEPTTIVTHHPGDLNIDHTIVHSAVMAAVRPISGTYPLAVLAGEVPSSTEWNPFGTPFVPTEFVDITATMEKKIEALRCYDAEMRPSPHPRSYERVRSLAEVRGSQGGLELAEAFVTLRRYWPQKG